MDEGYLTTVGWMVWAGVKVQGILLLQSEQVRRVSEGESERASKVDNSPMHPLTFNIFCKSGLHTTKGDYTGHEDQGMGITGSHFRSSLPQLSLIFLTTL